LKLPDSRTRGLREFDFFPFVGSLDAGGEVGGDLLLLSDKGNIDNEAVMGAFLLLEVCGVERGFVFIGLNRDSMGSLEVDLLLLG
jgi:hypothetical protein